MRSMCTVSSSWPRALAPTHEEAEQGGGGVLFGGGGVLFEEEEGFFLNAGAS